MAQDSRATGQAQFVDAVLRAMLDADPGTSVVIFDRKLEHRTVSSPLTATDGDEPDPRVPVVAMERLREELESAYRAVIRGRTFVVERETDDRSAIVSTTFRPLYAEGRVIGGIAISVDVTARRREQALLADAETMFEQTFGASPIGMAIVAPDGRWLKVNPAVCALLGRTRHELLDGAFQDVTHPADLDADIELVRQTLDGDRDGYEMVKRYLTSAGHTVWVQLVVSLIRNQDGTPRWFVSQMMDITARRQLDDHLRHAALQTPLQGL